MTAPWAYLLAVVVIAGGLCAWLWWETRNAPTGCDDCQGQGWCTCHLHRDPRPPAERHVRRWPHP